MITLGFLAYGVGGIAMNGLAFVTTNPNVIISFCGILIIGTILPGFGSYYDSPYFLMKKGRVTEMIDTIMKIHDYNRGRAPQNEGFRETTILKLSELLGLTDSDFLRLNKIVITKNKKSNKGRFSIKLLLTNKTYIYQIFTMSLIGGLIYALFYGMSINIQDLGTQDAKINGILLGVTQSIGYFLVLPYTHVMKRKRWLGIFQVLIIIGAVFLTILSKKSQTGLVKIEESLVSTMWMSTIISASFPIFFIYISELFPTEVRGTANAMILFWSKMVGSAAPILGLLSVEYGMHILVGCSVIGLMSLPLSIGLRETYSKMDT